MTDRPWLPSEAADPILLGVCDVTARVLGGIELPETSTEGATS